MAPPAKSKMAARGPQNCQQCFGRSRQLSLNKFFDASAPSMRKVDDGIKRKRKKSMLFLVTTNVVTSWPPERGPT